MVEDSESLKELLSLELRRQEEEARYANTLKVRGRAL